MKPLYDNKENRIEKYIKFMNLKPLKEFDIYLNENSLLKIKDLIIRVKNINIQDEIGISFLHWSCRMGNFKVVKFLIKNGADVNLKTTFLETPLDEAKKMIFENKKEEYIKIIAFLSKDKKNETTI